ncbi:aminoglycoside phosphotransferase family protein [Knoellia subterranea]|uniref:Aminoglycoside phosphotransferase domain-containing protein n=1 Tax=Knoellia subterranea KCTC 19937 TaxID=1385521 RepID=A0A0A0JMH3_9MICO|nr:aminoglycoside phosphotransferase family protein [Knoellia subterranea]KGN36831.1 hypothetical protein N803_17090 [Knoellia subterranea KCTC 19937]
MVAFAEWVRSEFGLGTGPLTFVVGGRGAVGEVYRLSVGGVEFAVKRPFRGVDVDAIRREALLLDHLAAQGIDVPTHVVASGGRLVVEVPSDLGGGSARVSHWVEGEPVGNGGSAVAEQLGALLAQLHRAGPSTDEVPPNWYTTMVPADEWAALVQRSVGQPWHEALVAREGDHAAYRSVVDRAGPGTGPFVLGHRDFHPDNAVIAPDGSLRALDWECCGPLDPTRELAKTLVQWHVLGEVIDEDAVARTVTAYVEAGGTGVVRAIDDFAMVMCTETNFLASQIRLALADAAPDERRAQARGEIEESLAGYLPSLAALERVLDIATA